MRVDPGTIVYWTNFAPGHDKFVYVLGVMNDKVFSFTISSQLKYLNGPLRTEMVEIPFRSTNFLNTRSFIQCFYEVTRTPVVAFQELEQNGAIRWRACLPQYLPYICKVVNASDILSGHDIRDAVSILSCK